MTTIQKLKEILPKAANPLWKLDCSCGECRYEETVETNNPFKALYAWWHLFFSGQATCRVCGR